MVCEKMKFKITVYFVTSVRNGITYCFIKNKYIKYCFIKNKNKYKDRGVFGLQNIKKWSSLFIF